MTLNGYRQSRRVLVVALLWLPLLGNVSGGMVVCFGASGHVAVEPAGHDHCADAHARAAEHGHLDMRHDECIPCVDIPLFLGPLDHRSASAVVKSSVPTTAVSIDFSASGQDRAAPTQRFTRRAHPASRLLPASIVLQV